MVRNIHPFTCRCAECISLRRATIGNIIPKQKKFHDDSNPYLARIDMNDKQRAEDDGVNYEERSPREKSLHQQRVEDFMVKAGQEVPTKPTVPSEEVRLLRAKLILEEALETIDALGFCVEVIINSDGSQTMSKPIYVPHDRGPNLNEVVDGCCDIRVVTTGTLSAFGIADVGPQRAVDESNLRKFGPGGYRRDDGKWIKPTDWVAPDWGLILKEQELGITKAEIDKLKADCVAMEKPTLVLKDYQGHICPHCSNPVSDEVVKKLFRGEMNEFACVNCVKTYRLELPTMHDSNRRLKIVPSQLQS